MAKFMRIVIWILALVVGSCSSGEALDMVQKRDNDIDISDYIHEFNTGNVILGQWLYLETTLRWLYVLDSNSPNKLVKVFEGSRGFYAGEIADYGPGPEEIGQPDLLAAFPGANGAGDRIVIIDHAQHKILAYETEDALANKNYHPHKLLTFDAMTLPAGLVMLNDSIGLAERVKLDPSSSGFSKELARFNLSTGEWEAFIDNEHAPASNFVFDVSAEHDLIAAGDYGRDRLSMYRVDGTPIRHVLSPDYNPEKDRIAFSNIEITDKYILAVYSGDKVSKGTLAKDVDFLGKKILVFNHDGTYVATLDSGEQIRSIKYHLPSNRLYLALGGEVQIGWIDIEEVLAASPKHPSGRKAAKEPNPGQEVNQSNPIQFTDIPGNSFSIQDAISNVVTSKDFGKITPDDAEITSAQSPHISILCNPDSKADSVVVEELTVNPSFLRGRIMVERLFPGLITTLFIDVDNDAPKGSFEGELKIRAKGFDEPAVLHISGFVGEE